MELNKIIAELDFISATVHNIEMTNNSSELLQSSKRSFSLDIKHNEPIVQGNKKYGGLLLEINISVEHEEPELSNDSVKLVIEGRFSASSAIDDDEFLEMLNINGGAALYSIARAKIEAISGIVYDEGKLLLPMINIVEYYQEKYKNVKTDK